jgi:mannan endo-1,4-beta-mannosidase
MNARVPRVARAVSACMLFLLAMAVVALQGCGNQPSSSTTSPGSGAGGSSVATPVAPSACGTVEPPSKGAFIGIYRPPAPFKMEALASYTETISPKPPALLAWYQPWAESGTSQFDQAMVASVFRRAAVPLITWEPWDPGTNANMVKDPGTAPDWRLRKILDGDYDDYIQSWARSAKAARGPVMIRPMPEMNGRWYPWSGTTNGNTPQEYVETWRYIHDMFEAEGASNVTWVWSINWESIPNTAENRFAAYYPGDEYVDWVGISGFNWGTTDPPDSRWRTFEEIYRKPLAYLRTLGKPIVLAEIGCVEQGGSKADWLTDAYARVRTAHPEVKAVVYFDSLEVRPQDVQDWRIATSASSAQAYRAAVADPYYLKGPSYTLANWVNAFSAENRMYLRSLPSVY